MLQALHINHLAPEESAGSRKTHCLLFAGHMIDHPDRRVPRFPPSLARAVREAIAEAVKREQHRTTAPLRAIAGGACGGDILFHEVCEEAGIPSELFLALPPEQFVVRSVQFAGPVWVDKFNRLYQKLESQVLAGTTLPCNPLQQQSGHTIWEQNNQWMLNAAMVNGGPHMTLMALWDKKEGDRPGGTAHMVSEARASGAKIIVIDINELLLQNVQG